MRSVLAVLMLALAAAGCGDKADVASQSLARESDPARADGDAGEGTAEHTEVAGAQGDISAEDFGDEWPLTVDHAELRCLDDDRPVVAVPGEGVFGLTGYASTLDGVEPLEPDNPLWADDPDIAGAKKNISPLRDAAVALC